MAALRIALERADFGVIVAGIITFLGFALFAGASFHSGL
jgi:hypothetical protein